MTQLLQSLKITAARKLRAVPEVVKRRNKLLQKLNEQRALADAMAQGLHYAPKRMRAYKDADTGNRVVKEVPVRIKPWFWTGEKGELLMTVQYGSRAVELSKGKTAVEVGDEKQLLNVIDVLIAAVQNGELDVQLEAASSKLRDGFKK